jgi:hypothetical protein
MNWDMIQGVLRAVLSAVGGYAVAKGYFDSATANAVVAAVLVLGSAGWSVMHNAAQAKAAGK